MTTLPIKAGDILERLFPHLIARLYSNMPSDRVWVMDEGKYIISNATIWKSKYHVNIVNTFVISYMFTGF